MPWPQLVTICLTVCGQPDLRILEAAADAVKGARIVRDITRLQSVPARTRVTGTLGAAAARAYVGSRLERVGLTVSLRPFVASHPFDGGRPVVGTNLLARLGPAEGPALVLVAHLDTKAAEDAAHAAAEGWRWDVDPAPGADDDASGAAALLEVARVLAPMQEGLRRPILLAWTDAEELADIAPDGFMENLGAEALAADLAGVGQDVAAALAVDMLLAPRPYGYLLRLYSDGRAASERLAADFALAAAMVAPELVLDRRVDPAFTYSDHGAFWALGQGGLLLIEDDFHHPRYHRPGDWLAAGDPRYDPRQVAAATRALAAGALLFAGAEP